MSLKNFLVFFLFLLILQPNFLIKRFLIKETACIGTGELLTEHLLFRAPRRDGLWQALFSLELNDNYKQALVSRMK